MRNLQTSDIFAACRLVSAIGMREELRAIAQEMEGNAGKRVQWDFGFDFLLAIIDKAAQEKAENEVYKFIAGIFECECDAVREMDPIELFDKLGQVADWEKWKAFFDRLMLLLKKKQK